MNVSMHGHILTEQTHAVAAILTSDAIAAMTKQGDMQGRQEC